MKQSVLTAKGCSHQSICSSLKYRSISAQDLSVQMYAKEKKAEGLNENVMCHCLKVGGTYTKTEVLGSN